MCGYIEYKAQCISNDPTAPCCNELINIDPHNNSSFTRNSERIDINFKATNNLEWVNVNKPNFIHNKIPGNNPSPLSNPWVQNNASLYPFFSNWGITGKVDPLTNQPVAYSNMDPRYGWQLLHSHTNYQPFSTVPLGLADAGFSNGPYFLFYNKYTGHLRALVYPEGLEKANSMQFRLGFGTATSHSANNNTWYASSLFNSYNDRMQALDQKAEINSIFAIADNTQGGGDSRPYVGDFNLSYDPCVCNTLPELEFDVHTRDNLKLYAEGRLVAISSPFNKDGTAPYKFGKDFMSSIWSNHVGNRSFEAKNGFLVYNKADQLAQDFYVSPEMQFLSGALGLFGKAVNGISLSTGYTPASLLGDIPFLPSSIRQDTSKIKIPIGNILSAGFDTLSSSINPPTPNVFLIEGQMALRGEITNSVNWPGFNKKNIGHPGSPINKSVGKHSYPYYNEAPGLFALLKTPEIDMKLSHYHDEKWTQGHNPSLIYEHSRNTGIAVNLINGPLEFALNPAAEIDMEKTKIYASIEFDLYSYSRNAPYSTFSNTPVPQYVFYNDFWGIKKGDYSKYAIPQMALKDYNNFYKDNFLNYTRKNTPFAHSTRSYVNTAESILEKSFYVVRTDVLPYTDIIDMVKKKVPSSGNLCESRTIFIFDEEQPDEQVSKAIWEAKYKGRLHRNTIQTSLVPIESLHKFDFNEQYDHLNFIFTVNGRYICYEQMASLLNPRLKITASYVFKPNQYGEINSTQQVYTYNLKPNYTYIANDEIPKVQSKLDLNEIGKDLAIGNTNYTAPTTIYGKNITINGNLSSNGSRVRIIATGSVVIVPPATIDQYIEIIIDDVSNQKEIKPVSQDFLAGYCSLSNGTYKAKEPNNKMASATSTPSKSKSDFATTFTLQPNPASDFTRLVIDQPVGDRAMVIVYDMIGREVYSQEMLELDKGKTSLEISTQEFHRGIYIVKVIHGELEQSLKLEVTK